MYQKRTRPKRSKISSGGRKYIKSEQEQKIKKQQRWSYVLK